MLLSPLQESFREFEGYLLLVFNENWEYVLKSLVNIFFTFGTSQNNFAISKD